MLEKIINNLGGAKVAGPEIKTELDMVNAVRMGFKVAVIDGIMKRGGLSKREVEVFIIKKSTLAHRKSLNQHLSTTESEHALRLARIIALAEDTFDNSKKAHTWLRRPNRALINKRPLELLDTEEGARIVETMLGEIAYGLFN